MQSRKVSKLSSASSPHRPLGLLPPNVRPSASKLPKVLCTKAHSPKLGRKNPRFLALLGRRSLLAEQRDRRMLAPEPQLPVPKPEVPAEESRDAEHSPERELAGNQSTSPVEAVSSLADEEDVVAGDSYSTRPEKLGSLPGVKQGSSEAAQPAPATARPQSVKRQLYVEQDDSDSGEDGEAACDGDLSSRGPEQGITRSLSSMGMHAERLSQDTGPVGQDTKRTKLVRRSGPSFRPPNPGALADVSVQQRRLKLHSGGDRPSLSAAKGSSQSSDKRTMSFFHGDLWMEKQMRAYTAWLNHLLAEPLPFLGGREGVRLAGLQDRRLSLGRMRAEERVRQRIWYAYARDERTVGAMIKVEKVKDLSSTYCIN